MKVDLHDFEVMVLAAMRLSTTVEVIEGTVIVGTFPPQITIDHVDCETCLVSGDIESHADLRGYVTALRRLAERTACSDEAELASAWADKAEEIAQP